MLHVSKRTSPPAASATFAPRCLCCALHLPEFTPRRTPPPRLSAASIPGSRPPRVTIAAMRRPPLLFLLLLSATCPLRADDHFLTIGGGSSPDNNQVSLEKNILYFRAVLAAAGLG